MKVFAGLLTLLLLTGCSGSFFPPPAAEAFPPGLDSALLAASDWTRQEGPWRLRQTVEFDFHGRQLTMRGLMSLDPVAGTARLIAVDDLGIKLFDLSVYRDHEMLHFLLPDLGRYPRLLEAVAIAVRRMFIAPRPQPGDALKLRDDGYELQAREGDVVTSFLFRGGGARLDTIRAEGPGVAWQVGYYDYHRQGELEYPEKILLEDRIAGYRLRLRIEEMRAHHE
ncbi:hypothetical protein JCM30471_06270 [Desulfuromonas carbonis]|uniref:DUF3261 domain-containing protein n=1 Tax=Desulfuromonas sp. DDH964 TaxID=1823759 RepID=UPI00078E3B86|nr:DUF3261 domain-containing protein [Desulfuromonas sp. DDH964]AMV72125.1 hypothetical protein DBW_1768 [Desulfuromonas sp. DDH964]